MGEFGEFLQDALASLGVVLPDADPGKIDTAEAAWHDLASSLHRSCAELDTSLHAAVAIGLPQHARIASCRDGIARRLDAAASSADAIASYARALGDAVAKAWEEIGWLIAQMAIEIALEIGVGVALSVITVGAGAIATAAKVAFTVARWAIRIAEVCQRLAALVRAALVAARIPARGAAHLAKDSIASGIAGVATQIGYNEVRAAVDPGFERQGLEYVLAAGVIAGVVPTVPVPKRIPTALTKRRIRAIDLADHEAAGGHLIARHVGKADEYLVGRGKRLASTFVDLSAAHRATTTNLLENRVLILDWLKGTKFQLKIDASIEPAFGRTWVAEINQFVQPRGVTTILHRDPSMECGFRIQTSFPTP
ncbi:RNase A-like domain-containing protein [Agromyces sp. MMS24-JH15]|uniref:RNase A-like domain-containing protein n=1 Tax=Agromyces sp. MMS24-JH15 TaxID=3243765 RepID=UPI0037489182